MQDHAPVTLAEIDAARSAIVGLVRQTPMVGAPDLSAQSGVPVFLKLEHHQITGSFKLRGATHALNRLDPKARAAGVVAASTGNHGRGLAHAARAAGVRCVIVMSRLVPANKVEGIRALGAEIRIVGASQDEAQLEVDRLVAEAGMTMLPPFDHADIIAGQGTVGLELLEQQPEIVTVLVPLSGGGLISGVAAALKGRRPDIRIFGVSMERGAAMQCSLRAGYPVEVPELPTLADSLGGGIGLDNRHTFAMTRDLVDEIVLVTEAEIASAIRYAWWQAGQVIEGSGAVGIAALLAGKIQCDGPVAVVVSGGNIDPALHARIVAGEDVDVAAEMGGE